MKRLLRLGLFLILALLVWACGQRTLTIGVMVPLTGGASEYGKSIRRGMEMALEDINGAGGVQSFRLNIELRDSGRSLPELESAAHELADDLQVPVIFGPVTSGATRGVLQALGDRHVVVLSPSATSPDLCTKGGWFFRNYPGDDHEGQTMARAALKRGMRDMVLVTAKSPYGLGLRRTFGDTFRQGGGTLRSQETLVKNPDDLDRLAESIAAMRPAPDGVFVAGLDHQVASFLTAFQRAGGESQVLTVSSVGTEEFLQQAGSAAEGIIYAMPPYDPQGKGPAAAFVKAFRNKHGEVPDIYAAHAYDAMHMLALAMENGVNPRFIREGLLTLPPYQGVTGMTSFLDDGDVDKPYRLWTIEQGQPRRLPAVR